MDDRGIHGATGGKNEETLVNEGVLFPMPDEQTEALKSIAYYMKEMLLVLDKIEKRLK